MALRVYSLVLSPRVGGSARLRLRASDCTSPLRFLFLATPLPLSSRIDCIETELNVPAAYKLRQAALDELEVYGEDGVLDAFEAGLRRKIEVHGEVTPSAQQSQSTLCALKCELTARKTRTDSYIQCSSTVQQMTIRCPPGSGRRAKTLTTLMIPLRLLEVVHRRRRSTDKKREAAFSLAFGPPMARTKSHAIRPFSDSDSAPGPGAPQACPQWHRFLGAERGAAAGSPNHLGDDLYRQVVGAARTAGMMSISDGPQPTSTGCTTPSLPSSGRRDQGRVDGARQGGRFRMRCFAERMSDPEFVLFGDKEGRSWVDRAAGWLAEGYAASGIRRDAMPRVQVPKSL
ncbi:hypothetical protein V8D89_005040 [Ganoderma adspersum]